MVPKSGQKRARYGSDKRRSEISHGERHPEERCPRGGLAQKGVSAD